MKNRNRTRGAKKDSRRSGLFIRRVSSRSSRQREWDSVFSRDRKRAKDWFFSRPARDASAHFALCQKEKSAQLLLLQRCVFPFCAKGGASHVVSVDSSEDACRLARENTLLNHFDLSSHEVVAGNVFPYLRRDSFPFDLVILDPPAFAKQRKEVQDACRGYKEINRAVFERLPPHSFLLTCSCSHFVSPELFQQVIFQAAMEANREVVICSRHIQTPDHPISLYHPEGEYLKSLFLHVN